MARAHDVERRVEDGIAEGHGLAHQTPGATDLENRACAGRDDVCDHVPIFGILWLSSAIAMFFVSM